MSGTKAPELAEIEARLEDVRDALKAQNRALAVLATNQQVHAEMIAQVLEAVTKEPEGDPLGELLRTMTAELQHHSKVLGAIAEAVGCSRTA